MTTRIAGPVCGVLAAATLLAAPSVFPTGTTIYDPSRPWSGFTVLSPLAVRGDAGRGNRLGVRISFIHWNSVD